MKYILVSCETRLKCHARCRTNLELLMRTCRVTPNALTQHAACQRLGKKQIESDYLSQLVLFGVCFDEVEFRGTLSKVRKCHWERGTQVTDLKIGSFHTNQWSTTKTLGSSAQNKLHSGDWTLYVWRGESAFLCMADKNFDGFQSSFYPHWGSRQSQR